MDLSKLSDSDLEAIASRDMSRVSTEGLQMIAGDKESPSFKSGRESSLRGLYSVLQGPSFGFADEIGGALAGGLEALKGGSFLDQYKQTRDYMRGAAKQVGEDNPIFDAVTQGVASLPMMALGGPAKPALGMASNALNAAKTGGIFGGLSGLGKSEATTLPQMAMDTATSAATGAALSGIAAPVTRGIGGMYDLIKGKVSDSGAESYARQKIGEAFLRDARGSVARNSPDAALDQVSARLGKLGPDARVVDAAGMSTRQLLDTTATLPGSTKDAVERAIIERQAGRADRMRGALVALSDGSKRFVSTIDDLLAQRSRDAAPIYDRIYKTGMFVDDELKSIIEASQKLGASGAARKIATAKQLPFSLEGDPKWVPMRDLDYLKQGLDDVIEANKNEFGKLTKVGAAVEGLRKQLIGRIDEATNGLYAQARAAYAGPSAMIDAAKAGRAVWSSDDATISKLTAGMGDSEVQAFKIGAAEALRAKLGNMSGQTEVMRMWRDKTTREKLQAIFGDERAFREFASTAAAESRKKGLEQVGRGSQTAARQYAAGDLDLPAVAGVINAARGGVEGVPSFLSGAQSLWNKVKTPEPVRDRIGQMLLQDGPMAQATLDQITSDMRRVAANRAIRSGLLGLEIGGGGGPVMQGLLNPQW